MAFDDGVKTVSGSIAHTDDAAAKVPFVSVKCGIEPTLTGVTEIDCTLLKKNFFSYDLQLYNGYWLNNTFNGNGQPVDYADATGWHFYKIPVKEGDKITCSGMQALGGVYCAFFKDTPDNIVSMFLNGSTNGTRTVPTGANFVGIEINRGGTPQRDPKTEFPNAQLEISASATSYEAYNATLYHVELPKSKNLIIPNDESKTFSANAITNYDVATLELKKDVTYTFSAYQNTTLTSSTRNTLRITFDGSYTYENTGTNFHNNIGVHSMSITPTQDGTAVFAVWAHTPSNAVTYSQFMVEEGTHTNYEPYSGKRNGGEVDIISGNGSDTYAKDSMFSSYLSTLNSDYIGYESATTYFGGHPSVWVRNWNYSKAKARQTGGIGCLCNHFPVSMHNTSIFASQYRIYFDVYDKNISSVSDFINYFANLEQNGDSVDLVYELATPLTYTITPREIETVGNINNVYCNTGDTEVTYHDNAHGFAEVTVNRCGKNVWDEQWEVGAINVADGKNISNSNFIRSTNYIGVRPSTTYYKCAPQNILQLYYGKSKNYLSYGSWGKNGTFTTPSDCCYVRFYVAQEYGTTYNNDISINYPSTATSYEAYSGVSQTAYLHKVIYGGKADVVKGTCEPKNLFDDSTFPRTATDNTYYAQFQSNLAEGNKYKIPTIHIEPDVAYVLSFDVECDTEPFNASVGIGIGSYSRDIANANNNTSGRISVPFTLTSALKEQYGDILSFRVPRYSSPREFTFTISNVQLEKASSASEYAPHFEPFSFPPISISTDEGENNLFANEGDSAITYRKAVD